MKSREEKLIPIIPNNAEIRRIIDATIKLSDSDFDILIEKLKKGMVESEIEK